MPFVTSHDKTRIFYRAEGPIDGPPVIFSNSLGSDHMMWQPQAEALRESCRVIRYDQRGHGASDVPEGGYTLDELGKDVLAIADHLGIDRFNFCGISMGGLTGQWLGINAPGRVEKLILANTSAHFPPPEMWEERVAAIEVGGMPDLAEAVLGRFFTKAFHKAKPAVVDTFRSVLLQMNPLGYIGCCNALKTADTRDDLKRIKTPTLILSGEHDQSTPPERGEFIAGEIAGAEHVVFDAAHISNVEQADAFNLAAGKFLSGTELPDDARFTAGLARRRQVLGDPWVDQAIARRSAFNAEFQDYITRAAWGDVWTRPGLDETTRRLLVLAITASMSRWEEFDLHARAAIKAGVSAELLKETFLQTAVYAGAPAANTAFKRTEALLDEV